MTGSYAPKSHLKLLMKAQNSTVRQILDMPWYVRNFHIYKEIELSGLKDFIRHLNLNFHLALENTKNNALNTLAEYDEKDPRTENAVRQAFALTTSFKLSL